MRGFTLIELLVVIAIIGILSSIVLAAISDSKDSKADDCEKYRYSQVETLPANCVSYYF